MEPRKSFPEQLKEAYARPYTLPDVWKMSFGPEKLSLSSMDRSVLIVRSLREAVTSIKLNYLLIGRILFTADRFFINYVRLEDGSLVDLFTWAEREFQIKKSSLYAAQAAYVTFCIDDRESAAPVLKPEYSEYSHSQLVEMLPMSVAERNMVKPGMTVREIRDLKKQLKPKKTDESLTDKDLERLGDIIRQTKSEEDSEARDAELSGRSENSDPIVEVEDDDPDLGGPVHELDVIEVEPEDVIEIKAPKMLAKRILVNLKDRQDWLKNYRAWGLFASVSELGLYYYRYEFPNGDQAIVTEQRTEPDVYNKTGITRYWHLCKKDPKEYPHHFKPGGNSMSVITDYLCEKRWEVSVFEEVQHE